MEYVDMQQNIEVSDTDFMQIIALKYYILELIDAPEPYSAITVYRNGLTVEVLKSEQYKNIPVDWVIKLFS